ncbi:nucleoid-associated protein [Sphingobacterium sp. DR205]|uniref:nucleoid-associated protein n=1 Tax=Sphingobacterium sp. DR205 TaxID=2713573 RepID=UPI0013E452FF|nr:nucleoid-associated protein [Sphingobacterium sp. DR205]QIH35504.1 nucleoid-associated protein [Sphingobacterium sp. DR205]
MKVNRLIIHEIIKESKDKNVNRNISKGEINIDDNIVRMTEFLVNSFDDSNIKYGRFRNGHENAFSLNAIKYISANRIDKKTFFDFTRLSLNELVLILENVILATGGYYFFVDYEKNSTPFILVLIVRNKEAFKIDWENGTFTIDETANINIDKIAMGFRLNCSLLDNITADRNYIALVSNQGESLSDYFLTWTNTDITNDSTKSTQHLVNLLRVIKKPIDTDENEFRRNAFSWMTQYKKINKGYVNIDKLSDYLFGDKNTIKNYAKELGYEIETELKVNSAKLRSLVKYSAKSKGINVSFNVEDIDSGDITIDANNQVVVITNKSIFDKLLSQIENGTE